MGGKGEMITEFPETSTPYCLQPTRKVEEWVELNSAENPRTLEDDLLLTYWESAEHQPFIHEEATTRILQGSEYWLVATAVAGVRDCGNRKRKKQILGGRLKRSPCGMMTL